MEIRSWVLYLLLHVSICTVAVVLPMAEDSHVPDRASAPRPETTSATLDEDHGALLRRNHIQREKDCEKKYRVCADHAQEVSAEWQELQDMLIFWEARMIVFNTTRANMHHCGRLSEESQWFELHPLRRRRDDLTRARNFTRISTRSVKSPTSANSTIPNSSPLPDFTDCFNSSLPANSSLAKACNPQYSSSKTKFCDYNEWCDEGVHYRETRIGMDKTRLDHLQNLITTAANDASTCASFDITPGYKRAEQSLDDPSTMTKRAEEMVHSAIENRLTDKAPITKLVRRGNDGRNYATDAERAKNKCEHVEQGLWAVERSSADRLLQIEYDVGVAMNLDGMSKPTGMPSALPVKPPAQNLNTAASDQRIPKRETDEAAEACKEGCQLERADKDKTAFDECKKRVQDLHYKIGSNWNHINKMIKRHGLEFISPDLPIMKRDLSDVNSLTWLPETGPVSEAVPSDQHEHERRAPMSSDVDLDRIKLAHLVGDFWSDEYKDAFFSLHETTVLLFDSSWRMAKAVKKHIHQGMAAEASSKALPAGTTQATRTRTVMYTVTETVKPANGAYVVDTTAMGGVVATSSIKA